MLIPIISFSCAGIYYLSVNKKKYASSILRMRKVFKAVVNHDTLVPGERNTSARDHFNLDRNSLFSKKTVSITSRWCKNHHSCSHGLRT